MIWRGQLGVVANSESDACNEPVTTPCPLLLLPSSKARMRVGRPLTVMEQKPELITALQMRPTVATVAVERTALIEKPVAVLIILNFWSRVRPIRLITHPMIPIAPPCLCDNCRCESFVPQQKVQVANSLVPPTFPFPARGLGSSRLSAVPRDHVGPHDVELNRSPSLRLYLHACFMAVYHGI